MCAAADIERVYNLPMPHRKVRLSFDFFAIDTWDGPWHGEVGRASVDGVLVWSQQFAGNVGTHECGLSLSGWHLDQHAAVSVELAHVTSTVRVRIDTNVNGSPSDECVQDGPLNPMGLFTPWASSPLLSLAPPAAAPLLLSVLFLLLRLHRCPFPFTSQVVRHATPRPLWKEARPLDSRRGAASTALLLSLIPLRFHSHCCCPCRAASSHSQSLLLAVSRGVSRMSCSRCSLVWLRAWGLIVELQHSAIRSTDPIARRCRRTRAQNAGSVSTCHSRHSHR